MIYRCGEDKKHISRTIAYFSISFILSFLLYCLTIAPTFSWGDSADLAMRLVFDGDKTFVGTHRDYLFWRTVGNISNVIPIDDAGLRANIFTAFFGALTIGASVGTTFQITQSKASAIATGVSLAFSHTIWLLSVITEVYTFNTALVSISIMFAAIWWNTNKITFALLASLFCALSLLHHATGLVLAASLLSLYAFRISRVPVIHTLSVVVVFLLVSAPYWFSAISSILEDEGFLYALGLQVSQNPNFSVNPLRETVKFIAYLTFNFIGLGIVFIALGIYQAVVRRVLITLPIAIWIAAFIYAGITSSIPDKFNLYVMIYPAFSIFLGMGVWMLQNKFLSYPKYIYSTLFLLAMIPFAFYFGVAKFSTTLGIDLVGARQAPLRDNNQYFLFPPKNGDYGPRVFAEQAIDDVSQGGILISDYTLWRTLYFVQAVENQRPDVKLVFVERLLKSGIDDWIEEIVCDTRVFLATIEPGNYYHFDKIRARFSIEPSGTIYEVKSDCS